MFYCDDDAKENGWPVTGFKSYGKCEVCDEVTACNDYPSSRLPAPPNRDKPKDDK